MVKLQCPMCGLTIDGHVEAESGEARTPKPGDISICAGCTGYLRFTGDSRESPVNGLEPLPHEDFEQLPARQQLLLSLARKALERARERKRASPWRRPSGNTN